LSLSHPFRRWLCVAALAALAALSGITTAQAAPIPFADRNVQLTAREQPVAQFLADLFGLVDLPVAVSERVRGAVNGNFDGSAERVWQQIARSFNLVAYYDGSVVHIAAPGELATRTLPVEPEIASRVRRAAQELNMLDGRHTLRSTSAGTLVASGTRRFIEQVEELARSQTAAVAARPPQGFEVHFLRYAWAHDVSIGFGGRQVVVPGVASIVRALMTSEPRSAIAVSPTEQRIGSTVPKLKGQGLGAQSRADGASGDTVAALLAAYGGGQENKATPAVGTVPAAGGAGASGPALVLVEPGQARVEADTRLNAVIVRDAPERLAQYRQLISALDVEPQALEIEARIIDLDTERLRELGINWRANHSRSSWLFGSGNSGDLLLNPGNTPPESITPSGRGAFLSAVLGGMNELALRINALQEQGAAKVVSSPQVLTLSNVEAVFDTSRTFYVRVAGRDEVDLFSVSAGTTLRVTPHVFRDNGQVRIKLLVAIDDGSLSQQAVDAIPIVERATINTQALIFEGESLLVGGLTRESTSDGVTKVPFLGDIPFIGALFRSSSQANRRTERLFLIAPRLIPARRLSQGSVAPAPGETGVASTPATAGPTAPPPPPASSPAATALPAPTAAQPAAPAPNTPRIPGPSEYDQPPVPTR
jgi:type III secretion protein C